MVLGAVIIVILLSSTWLVKRYHQNCLNIGVFVIPVRMSPAGPHPRPNESQIFRYDDCLDVSEEQEHCHESRSSHQLLHHSLVLGCSDIGNEHALPSCWWINEEIICRHIGFRLVVS